MNCRESFYTQVLQQQNLLIDEQKTNESSPLYALANKTKYVTQLDTHSQTHYIPGQQEESINIHVSR